MLTVFWRNASRAHGRVVKVSGDVAEHLRAHAQAAIDRIDSSEQLSRYDPDAGEEAAGPFITDRAALLDTLLLAEIEVGSELDSVGLDELKNHPLHCYVVTVDTAAGPVTCIRKTSPMKLGKSSLVARLYANELSVVAEPVFAFDGTFDVILREDNVFILDRKNFEGLFKDLEAIRDQIPTWVGPLEKLFDLDGESASVLVKALERDSYLRRKFHVAISKPYFAALTSDRLEDALRGHGIEPSLFVVQGKLVIDESNAKMFVQLVNEDFFKGDFSGTEYAAGSKSVL